MFDALDNILYHISRVVRYYKTCRPRQALEWCAVLHFAAPQNVTKVVRNVIPMHVCVCFCVPKKLESWVFAAYLQLG